MENRFDRIVNTDEIATYPLFRFNFPKPEKEWAWTKIEKGKYLNKAGDIVEPNKRLIKHKIRITLFQVLCILFSLFLLIYPIVLDNFTQHTSDELIRTYQESYSEDEMDDRMMRIEQARAYNDRLSDTPTGYTGVILKEEELVASGNTPLGWIEIPALDQRIPIYHGTAAEVLQDGVGHLTGTSMPVGGISTHAALSAHSGMYNSRMFDDIDQLEVGDIFIVHVLGEELAYRVYGSEVVSPNDSSSLKIQKGRDLCSLITCYPYGVNTHRLIVHGERTVIDPDETPMTDTNGVFNQRTEPLWIALGFLVCLWFIWWRLTPKEIGQTARGLKRFYRHDKILDPHPFNLKARGLHYYYYEFTPLRIKEENVVKERYRRLEAWINKPKTMTLSQARKEYASSDLL